MAMDAIKAPQGKPLGINPMFRFGAGVVVPILRWLTIRTWRGGENIPPQSRVIVVCNHFTYLDPLVFAHFIFGNGRTPRFLIKRQLFDVPVLGIILRKADQIRVERESDGAAQALHAAVQYLQAGHCLGMYPEGTLTRDENYWPMIAKTGVARLAVMTQTPIVPVAQWGAQVALPRYSKRLTFWKRTPVTVVAGKPFTLERWYGREDDQAAMVEATGYVMERITEILEEIRGEKAPEVKFDPRSSNLPRTGNFMKKNRG